MLLGTRSRSKTFIFLAFALVTTYYIFFSGPSSSLRAVPYVPEHQAPTHNEPPAPPTKGEVNLPPKADQAAPHKDHDDHVGSDKGTSPPKDEGKTTPAKKPWEMNAAELIDWRDPDDPENYSDVQPGHEDDGKFRQPWDVANLQHEKNMRKEWRHAYKVTADLPTSNLIYGNTLESLENHDNRSDKLKSALRQDPDVSHSFNDEKPVRFNPYPDYNSNDWKTAGFAPYAPCKGATGELIEDLLVFKGQPRKWPSAKFGGYDLLGMDGNLCWERETRLGPYGLTAQTKKTGGETEPMDWDNVNWGDLQRRCANQNSKRFSTKVGEEEQYANAYPETAEPARGPKDAASSVKHAKNSQRLEVKGIKEIQPTPTPVASQDRDTDDVAEGSAKEDRSSNGHIAEKRTAVLLRSYTGMKYTDNDKQVIRALVTELSLKSGGEYEVFLLVHVKDPELRIFDDPETYQAVLAANVPAEFRSMTVLWNDKVVWDIYTEMKDDNEKSVHSAQWLSVQKFSLDHPQYDFIWNWEMDFRFSGHHYDLVDKLSSFAKKQPRKGMWERNERWYIPEYHGDYDTDFRRDIEERYGNDTIWGPVKLPFITPLGPKPPVAGPGDDDYEWGVGEDADVVTVGPMFNPINSNWVIQNHVWNYKDATHKSVDLPRRTTIVTQSRVSRRLLRAMHVENLRGNHVASEMTPQTVALLHGFKAVYAPHPVFMDRDWDGKFLNKWFNPGKKGESGGPGSPMGWGRERRYRGNTWYYRAEPPNRLYNNFMGWIDTRVGGPAWEETHGRPCLPSVMLHHVKNTSPTKEDHVTGFELAAG